MTEATTVEAQITSAYEEMASAKAELIAAEDALGRHEREMRVNHADALLEAKNERTAGLYLDGFKDDDEYRELEARKREAETRHHNARCEVERLQLTVKLYQATRES